LRATTVTEYLVPGCNLVIVHDRRPSVAHERPPGDAVATYRVIGLAPFDDGARQLTDRRRTPGTAATERGRPGTAIARITGLAVEAGPTPIAVCARTVKV
jgi:hypothetical protein